MMKGLVFYNQETLNLMERNAFEVEAIGIDGTYKVRPTQPPMAQFVTIQVISNHSGTPCVYFILSDHVTETWMEVVRVVRRLFTWLNFEAIEIITDFEAALRSAVQSIIPESRLVGCWFHFNQAILRYLRTNHLYPYVRDNTEVRRLVRLVMAIPHLPPSQLHGYPQDFHVSGGFEIAQNIRHAMRFTELRSRHSVDWALDGSHTRNRSTARTRNDRLINSALRQVTQNGKSTIWFLRRVSYAAEGYLGEELGRAEGDSEGRPKSPRPPASDQEDDEVPQFEPDP